MFVTDADNRQVLEYDGTSGAVQRWYAFGLGPDEVLNQMNVPSSTRATMIPDIQGSIIGTLDSATAALTKTGYQPYGENPANLTGTFRYTARRLDSETGGGTAQPSGLYYYRARTYSPTWGRFLQPDPIGYAAGNNLYAYVGNDPLNNTDPFGYQAIPGLVIGGVSGGVAGYIAGGWQGALIGGGAGAVVGIGAPSLSMAAARIAVAYTGSSTAGFSTGAATFSVLNAGAGALATVGTNVVEGLPTFSGVGVGALLGAAAPLLSGEAILVGAGGGVAAGLSELADIALSAQSGIFGTIGTVLISPPGQMK